MFSINDNSRVLTRKIHFIKRQRNDGRIRVGVSRVGERSTEEKARIIYHFTTQSQISYDLRHSQKEGNHCEHENHGFHQFEIRHDTIAISDKDIFELRRDYFLWLALGSPYLLYLTITKVLSNQAGQMAHPYQILHGRFIFILINALKYSWKLFICRSCILILNTLDIVI